MTAFFLNSSCFLSTCAFEPEGCFIDVESSSRIEPISQVVCNASKNIIRLRTSLKDNSINLNLTESMSLFKIA